MFYEITTNWLGAFFASVLHNGIVGYWTYQYTSDCSCLELGLSQYWGINSKLQVKFVISNEMISETFFFPSCDYMAKIYY